MPYFAAKWARSRTSPRSGLEHTIFRPSFVFGRDGGALPTFMRQVKLSPVVTVIGDGLPALAADLGRRRRRDTSRSRVDLPAAANRIFELGGPDTVDWNELYRTIAKVLGKRRKLVHVPIAARAQPAPA